MIELKMKTLVVVGLQWGDEGKGKIVDYLSNGFDIVARFQGGSNAGHTVKIGEEIHKFRLMPTGSVRGKTSVIGNGVVVDPIVLLDEINSLRESGIELDLVLSDRAHVITPLQIQIDSLQEATKGGGRVGTTKRGIGPTYADKVNRTGIRVSDLLEADSHKLKVFFDLTSQQISNMFSTQPIISQDDLIRMMQSFVQEIRDSVCDTGEYIEKAILEGRRILFEGAQGTLLDVDHGTYPYVTSSNCVASSASSGTGVSMFHLESVLGIAKAYTTRVGEGPFPTELHGDIGAKIAEQGHEFGTVTGRPRRCGWLDMIALRYAVRVNGAKCLAVTKLDVLSDLNPIKVCVGYDIDGTETMSLPASADSVARAKPIYHELDGWTQPEITWSEIAKRGFESIPDEMKEYIHFIEKNSRTNVAILSIGPDRLETIIAPDMKDKFLIDV